ncbi:MAG TPA: hypothetical protein VGE37_05005, partial [Archangium sp.]
MRWLVVVIGLVVVGALVAWQMRDPASATRVEEAPDAGGLDPERVSQRVENRTLVVKTRLGGAPQDVGVAVTCGEVAPLRATTSGGE